MPRETVTTGGTFDVKVGWAADRDVQVGVEHADNVSLFWLLLGDSPEALAKLGEQVRRMSAVVYEDDEAEGRSLLNTLDMLTPHYAGLWATLDRQDCNRLVRLLRRARDSAYGRDE